MHSVHEITASQCTRDRTHSVPEITASQCTRDMMHSVSEITASQCPRDRTHSVHEITASQCTRDTMHSVHEITASQWTRDMTHSVHEITEAECTLEASLRRRHCVMSKSTFRAAHCPPVPVLSLAGMEFQQPLHRVSEDSERNLETQGFPHVATSPFPILFIFIFCLLASNIWKQ